MLRPTTTEDSDRARCPPTQSSLQSTCDAWWPFERLASKVRQEVCFFWKIIRAPVVGFGRTDGRRVIECLPCGWVKPTPPKENRSAHPHTHLHRRRLSVFHARACLYYSTAFPLKTWSPPSSIKPNSEQHAYIVYILECRLDCGVGGSPLSSSSPYIRSG